jgi:thiol-disulfide isomerase/thioredoxin
MRRFGALLCAALAPALMAGREAEQVGRIAPACSLTSVGDGEPVALAPDRGKVLWIDFWASWCSSCAESFPFLMALDRDFRVRGLEIVAVNFDEEPEEVQAFLERHPARFEVAADRSGACPRDFGVEAMPTAYLVDRRGVIRHVHRGFRAQDAGALRELVEALLEEQAAPESDPGGAPSGPGREGRR